MSAEGSGVWQGEEGSTIFFFFLNCSLHCVIGAVVVTLGPGRDERRLES